MYGGKLSGGENWDDNSGLVWDWLSNALGVGVVGI